MSPPPIRVPEVDAAVLRRMQHATWLQWFAISLQHSRQGRGRVVTPFLLGAITKLQYASRYIGLLRNDLHWLARDNVALRRQIEKMGGAPPQPLRPDAEEHSEAPCGVASETTGFDPETGETSGPFERESDDDIYLRGSLATMFIGDPPMDVLPGGKGWVPYDREKAEAAKARGEKVTLNVRMPRQ
jgi:hypothetical protein